MTMRDLLVAMAEQNASDLHITAGVAPTLRVHGHLVALDFPPLDAEQTRALAYSLITEESVLRLFLAGVIPGLIQTALLAGWVAVHVRLRGYPAGARPPRADFVRANLRALPALTIPVLSRIVCIPPSIP